MSGAAEEREQAIEQARERADTRIAADRAKGRLEGLTGPQRAAALGLLVEWMMAMEQVEPKP